MEQIGLPGSTIPQQQVIWEESEREGVRGILNALVKTCGKSLDDKSLYTLLFEVEVIVNSRP